MSIGLVLEGGGTRGAYTSGVLDVFLQNGIEFPTVYGISAGACNALSYISRQEHRNYDIFYQYITDERYMSVASLYRTGSLFGFDFIFGELAKELLPFDYKTFFESPMNLKAGATDLATGEVVFFEKKDFDEAMTPVRASSSLPFVSPVVSFGGHELLDGGCAAPVPIDRSILDGNSGHVVVMTRDAGYRKNPRPEFPRAVLRVKYGDYPRFISTMLTRGQTYNNEVDLCRRLEQEKAAVIVRPSSPITVSRYEKSPERLREIYEMGMRDAQAKIEEIRELMKRAKG